MHDNDREPLHSPKDEPVKRMDQRRVTDAVDGVTNATDDVPSEVSSSRVSREPELLDDAQAAQAPWSSLTPALVGVAVAGGVLLLLGLARRARRPASDAALIRIVIETPRSSRKKLLPIIGGAVGRWLLERQLQGNGALGALASAVWEQRVTRRGVEHTFGAARDARDRGLGRFG